MHSVRDAQTDFPLLEGKSLCTSRKKCWIWASDTRFSRAGDGAACWHWCKETPFSDTTLSNLNKACWAGLWGPVSVASSLALEQTALEQNQCNELTYNTIDRDRMVSVIRCTTLWITAQRRQSMPILVAQAKTYRCCLRHYDNKDTQWQKIERKTHIDNAWQAWRTC